MIWPTERDISEASPAELRVWLASLPTRATNDEQAGVLERLAVRGEQLGLDVGRGR